MKEWDNDKHEEALENRRQKKLESYKQSMMYCPYCGWLPEPSDWYFRIKLAKEQTRKETAEKFAERLKERGAIKAIKLVRNGVLEPIHVEVVKAIDKTCKEFTEGELCDE